MLGEIKPGMQCAEFDALLADAIDHVLSGERRERFEQHKAACASCASLFAEVTSGLEWLSEMEEVAPPPLLVHNILAATSAAGEVAESAPRNSLWPWLRSRMQTIFAPVLTPRFGMSIGMAFFSITLMLNLAQIRIKDLTPHNISHAFYSNQSRLVKYYENMRLVYEFESRVRDLRNQSEENERERQDRSREHDKSRKQEPEQNQKTEPEGPHHREYSRDENLRWLASLRSGEAVVAMRKIENLATQRGEL